MELNSEFVKLPSTLKVLLDQQNIKQMAVLFNRYSSLIETYRDNPIIRNITAGIEEILVQARKKQLLRFMSHCLKEEAEIFLQLFPNPSIIVKEYLLPKIALYIAEEFNTIGSNVLGELNALRVKLSGFELKNFT